MRLLLTIFVFLLPQAAMAEREEVMFEGSGLWNSPPYLLDGWYEVTIATNSAIPVTIDFESLGDTPTFDILQLRPDQPTYIQLDSGAYKSAVSAMPNTSWVIFLTPYETDIQGIE